MMSEEILETKVTDEMLINAIYDDRSRVGGSPVGTVKQTITLKLDFHKENRALANNTNTTYLPS